MSLNFVITGGAGFIGSAVIKEIRRQFSGVREIYVVDNLTSGKRSNLRTAGFVNFIEGTVSGDAWGLLPRKADFVFHFADILGTKRVSARPDICAFVAINGVLRAVEYAIRRDARFFYASTSMIYGPGTPVCLEGSPVVFGNHPVWTYSAAKYIGEMIVRDAVARQGLQAVVGRFFNVIGPNQSPGSDHVVAKFIDAAKADRPLEVYSHGTQTRSFTYIDDAAFAAVRLAIMATGKDPDDIIFNIAAGSPGISVDDLASLIIKKTGAGSHINYVPYPLGGRYDDSLSRVPNIDKLKKALGDEWSPIKTVGEMIDKILEAQKKEV